MVPPARTDRPRLTVVRGTQVANLSELQIYAHLKDHGFDPELLGARRTNYKDSDVPMPVRRLATPPIAGRISRTAAGGYLIGQVSPYRYFHEYLVGFDRAVQDSDILFPVDFGHPTSFQCLKHRPRAKVVVQVWENIPFNWPEDRPLSQHYRAVLEKADFFVPFTRSADRALRRMGVASERRSLVYCGVDTSAFRPPSSQERASARAHLGVGANDVVVTFVGRLGFFKGIYTLLESLTEVDRRVRLQLVGAGEERKASRRARDLGVADRVKFWGWVPHAELGPKILWGSDLVVAPSVPTEQWREQFDQFVVESMAAALPAVGSRTGGLPEVIDQGRTGLLVTPDDPEELAQGLNVLATDAALRSKMGEAARKRVESMFDARKNAATLGEVLRSKVLGLPD
ncbi:MAG: glycosyltransferase family 4 protein [Euryarchaeota archaeon]|nr:glycosyltransferase family 4 protein [Euryarchaeota archaeon]MDE1835297.1 glycosyltransferase family 4 protein [Euryarchaeota archaeon]MDE1880568.1 glycosyltransferase family 4 protein [Euryarchaeota archaeon]MDE2043593.1 glycosyltransferase family 4 protein [Thermoplasmata archaeon]